MENPSFRKDIDFASMLIVSMPRALFCGHIDGSGIIPCVIASFATRGTWSTFATVVPCAKEQQSVRCAV